MPAVSVVVETPISQSVRVRQLEGIFDIPSETASRAEWNALLPISPDDEGYQEWSIGAIVGPSGAGKTTVARHMWPEQFDREYAWDGASVIDDFDSKFSMEDVSKVCMAVGFNTIPAWRRPFRVLSNGEQFRVELARHLLEGGNAGPIVVDEFTSVVDRQVAKIGANAVRKYVRKNNQQFVAVTCHYDIIDWLQPNWIFEPSTAKFAWRSVQPRPQVEVAISPVPRTVWSVFAPYHYMTQSLKSDAHCFGAFVRDDDGCQWRIAAFAAMGRAVTSNVKDTVMQCRRLVTLPDFQGLGLAFVLIDVIGSIYRAMGDHVNTYPAHPALIRSFDRSPKWAMQKKPGRFQGSSTTKAQALKKHAREGIAVRSKSQGQRPNAVFRYAGEAIARGEACRVLSYFAFPDGKYGKHNVLRTC